MLGVPVFPETPTPEPGKLGRLGRWARLTSDDDAGADASAGLPTVLHRHQPLGPGALLVMQKRRGYELRLYPKYPPRKRRKMTSETRLLTADDVAEILQVSLSFAYALLSRGELPSVRIGRAVRVRPQDLEEIIQSSVQGRQQPNVLLGQIGS